MCPRAKHVGRRVVHTQLLLRGGARTPLTPVGHEAFWRATLPSVELQQRLSNAAVRGSKKGARRGQLPGTTSNLWGELTTRGADEAFAVGLRLERWLADAASGRLQGQEEDEIEPGISTAVIATPDRRAVLTAKAVLRGLCLPGQVVKVDTTSGAQVRALTSIESGAGGMLNLASSAGGDDAARHDAALDLSELLGLEGPVLAGASWAALLDIAECAAIFGLTPEGALAETTWQALLASPLLSARALISDSTFGPQVAGRLVRLALSPSVRAAHSVGDEQLRLVVLPGFSLVCLATALGLGRSIGWPAPCTSLMLETLLEDATGEAFVRFWQLRDSWEVRPWWHDGDGPVRLMRLLEAAQTAGGAALTSSTDGTKLHGRAVGPL